MKSLSLSLFMFLFVGANTVSAQIAQLPVANVQVLNAKQIATIDLTGKWTGHRNQYSWDRKTFIESFQYEFNLKQEGNIITGTSTIINANGDYADMKLEGIIIGNKLHFAEEEIKSAIRPAGRVWCFKSGVLNIVREGNTIKLQGATPSYMEGTNYPCSGGVTDLVMNDVSNVDFSLLDKAAETSAATNAPVININVYPNPFVQNANIYYTLPTDSKVQVEVFDISGKIISTLFNGNEKSGSYNLNFSAGSSKLTSGVYVIKFTINDQVYSRQLVQMQ